MTEIKASARVASGSTSGSRVSFLSLSQQDLAEAHGVTVKTIATWTNWGMPRNGDKTYNLTKTLDWRISCSRSNYGTSVMFVCRYRAKEFIPHGR